MKRPAIQSALLAVALAASPIAAHAQKDLASCKPVFDALEKQATTPSHAYMTQDGAGGKSSNGEIIFVGGITYANVGGRWRKIGTSAEERVAQVRDNIKDAKSYACKRVRDGLIDGAPATLYEVQTESSEAKSSGQVWIAKGTNLPLRNDVTLDVDGDKTHSSMRYEYSNVRAPAGVK